MRVKDWEESGWKESSRNSQQNGGKAHQIRHPSEQNSDPEPHEYGVIKLLN